MITFGKCEKGGYSNAFFTMKLSGSFEQRHFYYAQSIL